MVHTIRAVRALILRRTIDPMGSKLSSLVKIVTQSLLIPLSIVFQIAPGTTAALCNMGKM